jgi:hypothetical protein
MSDNGNIIGSFEASGSLRLATSNAPIEAVVSLLHNESVSLQPSLDMTTRNGLVTLHCTFMQHISKYYPLQAY